MSEPSKGLGDSIAKLTTALKIKQCEPCKKRQELLNKVLPYGNPHPEPLKNAD